MDCIYYIHLLNTKQPTIATFKRNDTIRFSKILKKKSASRWSRLQANGFWNPGAFPRPHWPKTINQLRKQFRVTSYWSTFVACRLVINIFKTTYRCTVPPYILLETTKSYDMWHRFSSNILFDGSVLVYCVMSNPQFVIINIISIVLVVLRWLTGFTWLEIRACEFLTTFPWELAFTCFLGISVDLLLDGREREAF